ncbi:MAG: cupin domain-containing protein [Candidatus Latescibacteria bacterium]|nr:cupin domain-containing protein [Candidatus Latescibacterota bacterium]
MVIRHWMDSPIVTTHGRLREWQIFKKRQGTAPNAETGDVCFDFHCYGRAVVLPGVTTEPTTHDEEVESFFVSYGQGIVQEGKERREFREGSMLFIPAGIEHRITNTGSGELEMIYSRRPPSSRDADRMFGVRHWTEDRDQAIWGTPFQGHWHHIYRGPSCGDIHIGDIPPHKLSHPHNHPEVMDEIWYVRSGNGWHWMGQEYHEHTAGYALWLDPSELHSLMNPGDATVEYIYCSSGMLLMERMEAEKAAESEAKTNDPFELLARLEKHYKALVAGYRKTGVSIYRVEINIPGVEAQIEALRAALKR